MFDSIVLVGDPGGRFKNAHSAPKVSAIVIKTPPCSTPPAVQRSSDHSNRPFTCSGAAETNWTPTKPANGTRLTSCCGLPPAPDSDIRAIQPGCPGTIHRCYPAFLPYTPSHEAHRRREALGRA